MSSSVLITLKFQNRFSVTFSPLRLEVLKLPMGEFELELESCKAFFEDLPPATAVVLPVVAVVVALELVSAPLEALDGLLVV